MTVNPVPRIVLDGAEVTTTAGATRSTGQAVLDGLTATWGRERLIDHHDAQQGSFSVYDANYSWGARDLIGAPVTFEWTAPGATRTFFRGRITDHTETPNPTAPNGRRRGVTHKLAAAGTLSELGARETGKESWPAESGAARMSRIAAAAGGAVAGIAYRDYWDGAPMGPRTVDGTNVLSLLRSMYDSAGGDRLGYDPHSNTIADVARRGNVSTSRTAYFASDPAVYPGGVFARATYAAGETPPPMLDGTLLEGTGAVSRTVESRITRTAASYTDSAGTSATVVQVPDPATETARGVRGLSLSTELGSSSWAALAANDWFAILTREGAARAPAPVTYHADRASGFASLELALILIGGVERGGGHVLYVSATPWPRMGVIPAVCVIGGTVRYEAGGWSPLLHLAPPAYAYSTVPVRMTVPQARAGTARIRVGDLAPSLTFADCRYLSP